MPRLCGELEGTGTIIEALDKGLDEIMFSVDSVIETAEQTVQARLANREDESVLLSSSKEDDQFSVLSISSSYVKQKQQEAKEASERLLEVAKEQKDKENELEKLIAELELTKQRTEEARKLAELSQFRAEAAKEASSPDGQGTVQPSTDPKNFVSLHNGTLNSPKGEKEQPLEKALPVKLKGVDLPFLAGEDKTDYESSKAAFMSIVD